MTTYIVMMIIVVLVHYIIHYVQKVAVHLRYGRVQSNCDGKRWRTDPGLYRRSWTSFPPPTMLPAGRLHGKWYSVSYPRYEGVLGVRGIDPLLLNFGTRWSWFVNFTAGKEPRWPLSSRVNGLCGLAEKRKIFCPYWDSNFGLSNPVAKTTPSHPLLLSILLNPLTPNDHYSGRTASLTSKRCILYIYSTNIGVEYFKHGIYSPLFPLQSAVCFIILASLFPVFSHFIYRVC